MSRYVPITPNGTPWGDAFLLALTLHKHLRNPYDPITDEMLAVLFDQWILSCVKSGFRGGIA